MNNELITISKLESAKLAVREVKEIDEIKRIIDQVEALKGYARAQKLSAEIQNDIAEYALYATRQMGEISAGIEKAAGRRTDVEPLPAPGRGSPNTKTEVLSNAGIDIRRANEAEKLAAIPEDRFVEIIEERREAGNLTKTAVMEAATKPAPPHISHNSGNNEWYTPKEYIDAARVAMGGIDCDPASSDMAQGTVQAKVYYTIETNGLDKDWHGRIWMNPPYSGDLISKFCDRLKYCVEAGYTTEAVVLVNNATETAWFNTLVGIGSAVVFPSSRVRFYKPDGSTGQPLQGQAVVYVGEEPRRFIAAFRHIGWGAMISKV